MIDIKEPIEDAQARANVSTAEFFALGQEGATELMLDLPSRAPGLEMMWWQSTLPLEGKEYIVKDGDVMHIRHSG